MKANDSDRDSTILYIQYNPPHHHYSVSSNANSNKPSCFCPIAQQPFAEELQKIQKQTQLDHSTGPT
jgi:hypothetical protein